jgi:hypothetical protein
MQKIWIRDGSLGDCEEKRRSSNTNFSPNSCLLGCCAVKFTDVSEALTAFVTTALMMKAARTSKPSVNFYQTSRGSKLLIRHRESRKSHFFLLATMLSTTLGVPFNLSSDIRGSTFTGGKVDRARSYHTIYPLPRLRTHAPTQLPPLRPTLHGLVFNYAHGYDFMVWSLINLKDKFTSLHFVPSTQLNCRYFPTRFCGSKK